MLMVYLRSLVRDEATVADLFQEAMVVAWRRLDECDLDQPFGPWLRGIASRLVLAHYRKQKTAPVMLHELVLQVAMVLFRSMKRQASRIRVTDVVGAAGSAATQNHHQRTTFPTIPSISSWGG